MKMKMRWMTGLLVAVTTLQGCATAANKKLDQELAGETAIHERKDVQKEASQLIQSTPGLSGDQRAQLTALKTATQGQLDAFVKESLKLRSVLVKDLVSSNFDADEIDLIKSRMKNLEAKKIGVIFEAVAKANTILGNHTEVNPEVFLELMEVEHNERF